MEPSTSINTQFKVNTMGKVLTTMTITNRADQILAEAKVISASEIRSITLTNVLADTGATLLCLPAESIAQLGLKLAREIDVATATGLSKARLFRDANLSLYEREGTFECLELPGGTEPLLGLIPLETLGLELDLQRHTVNVLPMGPSKTYVTIL
jgi:predicted aspartyl protease